MLIVVGRCSSCATSALALANAALVVAEALLSEAEDPAVLPEPLELHAPISRIITNDKAETIPARRALVDGIAIVSP
jgi:hypothetical protein